MSNARGRFNLRAPRGTLNVASSTDAAAREYLGIALVRNGCVPATILADRWISTLEMPTLRVADFMAGEAPAFGVVPGDIGAPMPDGYAMTRAWAAAMDAAGFDGIRSRSRFGTGPSAHCLYVFGPEGEHKIGDTAETVPLRSALEAMPGYRIDPVPASDTLVIDP